MCDRGSNFRKEFRGFDPLFCFGHRLNNILKRSFFQNQTRKKAKTSHHLDSNNGVPETTSPLASSGFALTDGTSSDESDVSSDDRLESRTAMPMVRRKKNTTKTTSKRDRVQGDSQSLHIRMTVDQVPMSVKQVLHTLHQCKRIVKYVKKVREIPSMRCYNTVCLVFITEWHEQRNRRSEWRNVTSVQCRSMVIYVRSVGECPRILQDHQAIACCKEERVSPVRLRRENY